MTRALWTHLAKDLRIEWRSLDAMISMLFFSGLVVVLFSIAFDPRGAFSQQIAGGVLCVATMFASVSALNQAWAREIRHQVMDAQRMVPAPGAELFLAKVIANFLFVTIVQVILAPFFFIFYNLHIAGNAWLLVAGAAAGHMGAGRQRRLLCRALHEQPQPRAAALAHPLSHLHSRASGHGAGHHRHPHRRKRPHALDQDAPRLRHHLHHRQPAALRRRLPRRVARFPVSWAYRNNRPCIKRGLLRPRKNSVQREAGASTPAEN